MDWFVWPGIEWFVPLGLVAETNSDADGWFEFSGLDCRDDYGIRILHAQHAMATVRNVALCRNESVTLPVTRLGPQTWISGSVTRAAGTPIAGANVEVCEVGFGPPLALDAAATDQDGFYRLRSYGRGLITVTARAPGHAAGVRSLGVSFSIPMDRREDFVLQTPQPIEGVVADETGAPVPFAEIRAVPAGPRAGSHDTCEDSAFADAKGRFRCAAVAPGTYDLIVHADGFESAKVDATPTGTLDARVLLRRTGAVAGRVVTHDGAVATRFTVRLKEVPGDLLVSPAIYRDLESVDGTFVCDALSPGDYVMIVWVDGYAPGESAPFFVDRGEVTDGVVIEVGVESSITGRVVDENGQPVCGARVRMGADVRSPFIEMLHALSTKKSRRPDSPRTITAHDGSFRLGSLAAARVELAIEHRDQTPILLEGVRVEPSVSTHLGTLTTPPGGSVMGVCRDHAGRPLPRCEVYARRVQDPPWTQTTETDDDGRYEISLLPPGEYTVSISIRSMAVAALDPFRRVLAAGRSEQRVIVAARETAAVDLQLPAPDDPP